MLWNPGGDKPIVHMDFLPAEIDENYHPGIEVVGDLAHTLWMLNERGQLIIAKLSRDGFHELSRAQLIQPTLEQLRQRNGVCWAHPAFAYRHVFARNDEELVCASLEAD